MIKRDLTAMRHLFEHISIIDEKVKQLRIIREELFDLHGIHKNNYSNYKIAYKDFLLTEAHLCQRDKDYIKTINHPEVIKKHYYWKKS